MCRGGLFCPPRHTCIFQKKRIESGIYAGQSAEENMRRALFRNDKIYEKIRLNSYFAKLT